VKFESLHVGKATCMFTHSTLESECTFDLCNK